MNFQKNQSYEFDIIDMTNLGFGVAKADGMVIFIADTVTGDRVCAKIIKATKSFCVAKAERILRPSSIRCEGRCSLSVCKSCAYRNLRYSDELCYKKAFVQSAFTKEGLLPYVEDVIPSPAQVHYRNKAQYPIALDAKGNYIIGYYAPKSHRVCEAAACPLTPPVFAEICEVLRSFFAKHRLSVYSEQTKEGLLRHIYLRNGAISGEILVTLVLNGTHLPFSDELVQELVQKFSAICGILCNENTRDTNVILGQRYTTLYGREYLTDTLAGVRLRIAASAFYQVNHDAAEILYQIAQECAAPSQEDTVLDLYCGAGSIGLSMAHLAKEVIGIEIVESAVACATQNAADNGITNASFYLGDATDAPSLLRYAEQARGQKICPDIVLLDPPRSGTTPELISYLCSLLPKRIVYISCNPTTLARDCKQFLEYGYASDRVQAVDFFPATGHVESVVCLTRK